ncbi:MAG TPA: hypothetical protein VMW16_08740 [Sedimentisphaerales bacterium]|nr:hypothetical protein [Sedimentisphaerales bacterium]
MKQTEAQREEHKEVAVMDGTNNRSERVEDVSERLRAFTLGLRRQNIDNRRLVLACVETLVALEDVLTSDVVDGLRDAKSFLADELEQHEKGAVCDSLKTVVHDVVDARLAARDGESRDDETLERILDTAEGIAEQLKEAAEVTS